MALRFTPVTTLSISVFFGLAFIVIIILMAIQQPWIGLRLSLMDEKITVHSSTGPGASIPSGTILQSIKTSELEMQILPSDLTIEPDGTIDDYGFYRDFLKRQGELSQIQAGKSVTFTSDTGENFTINPQPNRPLSDLPANFWVQLVVGLFAWLISSAVFAFRPRETSAKFLLLSGLSTLVFAPFAAVYTTRELAMPEMLFQYLSDGNFLGGSVFTASFVALLLSYPRRIAPNWLGPVIVVIYVIWFILQQNDVFSSMTFARRFLVMIGIFSTFILAGVHWYLTRKDPVARAALQWFLISWMLGTSLFWFFILMPQMFGVDTTPIQGYAFSLFLLVYGGLAFGILRYRLFDLGIWWGRIVIWTLTILMLILFDLLFLLLLQLSSGLSLSLALLLSGILWIPLRSLIWGRFLHRKTMGQKAVFEQIVDIALSPPHVDMNIGWRHLMQDIFRPLHIQPISNKTECHIEQDGTELFLPAIGSITALRLDYAEGGRKLFSPQNLSTAKELVAMLSHTLESRASYEKGVSEERQRIARDMHDNIGAQLLGALHNKDHDRKDSMIRETLTDLRDIINDTSRPGLSFDEMLADLRVETAERLSLCDIRLKWTIESGADHPIAPHIIHSLRAIIRESISNIIKHAKATTVTISIQSTLETVSISIQDDGQGFDPSRVRFGNGLANMESRITGLKGSLDLIHLAKGLKLVANFPLHKARSIS